MAALGVMLVVIALLLIAGGFHIRKGDRPEASRMVRTGGFVGLGGCALLALLVVF